MQFLILPLRSKGCTLLYLPQTRPRSHSPWITSFFPSTKHGNDCVFFVVDQFSKLVILVPCKKSVTTKATDNIFFECVWVHFGLSWTIISYRDSRFLSTFCSNMSSLMDTKLMKSTSFHPQSNGKTKVVNQIIMNILLM
jgi:hypothetical protein